MGQFAFGSVHPTLRSLSVGASLAARFQSLSKTRFTTENTEALAFLGVLCALCGKNQICCGGDQSSVSSASINAWFCSAVPTVMRR